MPPSLSTKNPMRGILSQFPDPSWCIPSPVFDRCPDSASWCRCAQMCVRTSVSSSAFQLAENSHLGLVILCTLATGPVKTLKSGISHPHPGSGACEVAFSLACPRRVPAEKVASCRCLSRCGGCSGCGVPHQMAFLINALPTCTFLLQT